MNKDDSKIMECINTEKNIVSLCKDCICLIDDMIESVKKNYRVNNMALYRLLCFCSLIICGNNIKAALAIINENLDHQVYYIRRNMLEIMVSLYYIDQDETKREELARRFFDYGSVNAFNSIKVALKYSTVFQEAVEIRKKIAEARFADFKKKYIKTKDGNALRTWSGKNLRVMINEIKNEELRIKLLYDYEVMNTTNNLYLHFSSQYCHTVLKEEFEQNIDYSVRYTHLHSMLYLSEHVIRKHFCHFQKNRIALKKRLEMITSIRDEIDKEAEKLGYRSMSF